jgi:hypothetical protein
VLASVVEPALLELVNGLLPIVSLIYFNSRNYVDRDGCYLGRDYSEVSFEDDLEGEQVEIVVIHYHHLLALALLPLLLVESVFLFLEQVELRLLKSLLLLYIHI